MNAKRTYTMQARARSVEDTRARILEALFELATVRMFPDISLDDVAAAAGVSVQTVLRHFGSREALIEETMSYGVTRVAAEMDEPVGDLDAAVRAIVDHHERRGDTSLMMLAQEFSHPQIEQITRMGREVHKRWVERVFAPYLHGDAELCRLLIVATDVYTWKILRRDMKLSRARTEQHVRRLVRMLASEKTASENTASGNTSSGKTASANTREKS